MNINPSSTSLIPHLFSVLMTNLLVVDIASSVPDVVGPFVVGFNDGLLGVVGFDKMGLNVGLFVVGFGEVRY